MMMRWAESEEWVLMADLEAWEVWEEWVVWVVWE